MQQKSCSSHHNSQHNTNFGDILQKIFLYNLDNMIWNFLHGWPILSRWESFIIFTFYIHVPPYYSRPCALFIWNILLDYNSINISLAHTHSLNFYIFSSIHLSSKIKYLYSIIWQYAIIIKIENLFKMLCIDSHAHSQSECIYLYISLFTWCQGWCWNEINNHSIESKW